MNKIKKKFDENKWVILLLLASLVPYLVYVKRYPFAPARDWDYFNSLGMLIGESFRRFSFPVFDFWVSGGVDNFANPQSWHFSPLAALYFMFTPYVANLASLAICSVFGFFGMYRLVNHVQDEFGRCLVALLFVLSPFFFLHFAEGHIAYRTFYFLPWILYFSQNLTSLKNAWWLNACLVFMFIDGGIYPFYFSIIISLINLNWGGVKEVVRTAKNWWPIGLTITGVVMIMGSKVLPVLIIHHQRVPVTETYTYSLSNIITALYSIKQTNYMSVPGSYLYFHEFGHYFGFGLTVLLIMSIAKFRKNIYWVLQLVLFLWIAFGIGGGFNPWSLIQKIPYMNHMHIQSRFLIVAYLLALYLISLSINNKKSRWLLVVAVCELMFCSFYTNIGAFKEIRNSRAFATAGVSVYATEYKSNVPKPFLYIQRNLSQVGYDPVEDKKILPSLSLFPGDKQGSFSAVFNGNKILIKSARPMVDPFLFNYNWNGGWSCHGCEAHNNNGIIKIVPDGASKVVELTYEPSHFLTTILLFMLGFIVFLFAGYRIKNVI